MTPDTIEEAKPSMSFTTRGGPRVGTIPVDSAGLIQLENQLGLNSAVSQMNTRSCSSLNVSTKNKTSGSTSASAKEECASNK